jgi:hypothetical protein
MFIDTCHYFTWVEGYFLHTDLEEISVQILFLFILFSGFETKILTNHLRYETLTKFKIFLPLCYIKTLF